VRTILPVVYINPLKPEAHLNISLFSPNFKSHLQENSTRLHDKDHLVSKLFKEVIAVYFEKHEAYYILWAKFRVIKFYSMSDLHIV
jgi:hypothetical protein